MRIPLFMSNSDSVHYHNPKPNTESARKQRIRGPYLRHDLWTIAIPTAQCKLLTNQGSLPSQP